MSTCKAWIPTDSGNRHCGAPATKRMQTRYLPVTPMCATCYERWRDELP